MFSSYLWFLPYLFHQKQYLLSNDSIYLRPSRRNPRDSQFSAHSAFQRLNLSRRKHRNAYITIPRILHNNTMKFIQHEVLLIFFVQVIPRCASYPMVCCIGCRPKYKRGMRNEKIKCRKSPCFVSSNRYIYQSLRLEQNIMR